MARNNFNELERIQNENLREPSSETKDNVDSSIGMIRFVGDIVDLYLPKLMDVLLHALSGGRKNNKASEINKNESDNLDSRYPNTY